MVGAVVVHDGRVVGEGYHARFGEPHAEVAALRAAGDRARGATLYVTLEPCRHHGKTPPCTDAILEAWVERVVIAALDPTELAGGGARVLRDALLDVDVGILGQDARELNAPFFNAATSDLPWTTLKLALSLESGIASERGTTSRVTGEDAQREAHHLRAGHDAIAVGVGTILADDSRLTVRGVRAPRVPPARVVFDRSLRTPLRANVVVTARETPSIVVTSPDAAERAGAFREAGVHIVAATDLRDGFRRLRAAGIRALLVEGGATFASAVLAEGLAQRLIIFQAPVALGANALHAFDGAPPRVLRALETIPVLDRRQLGPDVMTTYALADL
jgi:diaminohydroxyphosphoribosylaminopyrimidine deaminase/5-amino-6-(5-phosphoribosylamino)uracil reductase